MPNAKSGVYNEYAYEIPYAEYIVSMHMKCLMRKAEYIMSMRMKYRMQRAEYIMSMHKKNLMRSIRAVFGGLRRDL